MDYRALAEQVIKDCLNRGAEQAEVYLEDNRQLNLEVRNGQVESIQEAQSYGLGIRVVAGKRLGFAFVNDLKTESLKKTVDRALQLARAVSPDENNQLPVEAGETEVKGLYDPQLQTVPLERKLSLIKEVEGLALKKPGITRSAGASYGESESLILIASSSGWVKSYKSTGCGYGLGVIAEKGEQKSSGYESCSRRYFSDLKPAEEVASNAARKAVEMLDPRPIKTQRAAVILDPEVAYAILGGIIQAINGERVLQGASFLGKKMGQKNWLRAHDCY